MTSTRKRKTPAVPDTAVAAVETDTAPSANNPAVRINPFAHAGKAGWGVGGRYVVANGRRIRNHKQES